MMKDILENIFGFLYTLSMGDYIFFFGTFIILLGFIYIIYLIKRDESMETYYKDNNEIIDLNNIKESIEKDYKPGTIKLTDYEEEQEKNAIISYEELIKNKDKTNIGYDKEYNYDNNEISVKKITIDAETKEYVKSDLEVKLMKYDKEEEFLIALKQLQSNLIN